jgi:hypothetical protein
MAGLKRKREEVTEFVKRVDDADEKHAHCNQRIVQFGRDLEAKQQQVNFPPLSATHPRVSSSSKSLSLPLADLPRHMRPPEQGGQNLRV